MNQYSDIRLGGTLITTAIVICGGLAVAVLLPVLRTHRQQPQPGTHGSEIGSASDTTTLLPLEQLPDEESSRRSQLKTKNTEAQNKAIHRASIAQLVAQTDTGNTPAADQSREAPPTENSDGLHVPVNIHVDGSEFVESLTRLANSMDKILAVHRHTLVGSPVVHPITSAARSTDNAVASENEQLTKLNESLLKLSHDFDTLRLESRTAVRQLADDFNQTESAAELLDELRQTLIDHRHLLANNTQSHPLPVTRIAQQPGPVENPDPFEGNNSPIPESADTEQILPHSDNPDNSDQRNNFEVPLPPQAKKQLSADVIWETFVSGHGAEKSERNNQTPGSRVLSKATHDMLTSERTPRDTATAPVAGIHDKPLIVSKPAINSEDSRASSLMPVKDGPSQQESAVVLVPELPDVADRETEPVVYEQTFNFVLPPATNPLPEVQRPDTEKEESLDILPPVAPEKPTTPRDSAPAVPESSTESRKLIQKDARQKPKRITRNQRNRKSLQPKLFFQTQESSTAHVDRQPIIRTTHAQNQLRNDVSRRPHHKSPEYAHQHSSGTSKLVDQPTLLHRLRSSLLAAGRKRTID